MTYRGYGMTIPFMGVPLHQHGDWIRELVDLKTIFTKLLLDLAVPKWAISLGMGIVSYFLPTQAQREAMLGAMWLVAIDLVTGMIAARSSGKAITSAKLSRTLAHSRSVASAAGNTRATAPSTRGSAAPESGDRLAASSGGKAAAGVA